LNVCMISREFPPDLGGIGPYVYNLSKKLQERGHRIFIITRGSYGKRSIEIVDGIEVFRVPFFPIYPFHVWLHGIFVNRLFRSLEHRLNLVHLHSPITPPIKTSLPTITTVHTPMKVDARYHEVDDFYSIAERVQSSVIYPPLESKLFSDSKLVTAVSLSVAMELKEYGLDPNEIAVVRNGVDEKTFAPAEHRNRERYVLYTGVLRARKGLFDLIECARYVCKVDQTVKFVICGAGPFLGKAKKAAQKLGVEKRVIFLGYVKRSKLIQTYQNATVHVVPSHYEGLPNVLLEAMSCGLPVVATNISGNKEVITDGVNGFLVPPKSPKDMSEALLGLLEDDELRVRIGKAARATIKQNYTWNKVADKIIECYENVLQEQ
jgi:glycosyltransferase involved in cell wall biosynthesis